MSDPVSDPTIFDVECGWQSSLPLFCDAQPQSIVEKLVAFVRDSGSEQQSAWARHVPGLQREFSRLITQDACASAYGAILEYQLPYDLRRPDVIVLQRAAVVVAEMKGWRGGISQGAKDQVLGYARDLKSYHAACAERDVVPILITSAAPRPPLQDGAVWLCNPADLETVLTQIAQKCDGPTLELTQFLSPNSYAPSPTIVQAARALFEGRELPYIKRARAATDPALQTISSAARQAAKDSSRHLVLLSGVPGSGKTLVGLQLVHSRWLDDLSEIRDDGQKPTAPGVYLSGNAPLVEVLQHALKDGGGGGQTFVRQIKKYVEYYSKLTDRVPPEHLIVYDEAQRAHDAQQVAYVHDRPVGLSEPAHLLQFCLRVPKWSVLVGLIGTGQAIHVGEEAGLSLWREALDALPSSEKWTVHCATEHQGVFDGGKFSVAVETTLNLDRELRFHTAADVHRFIEGLVDVEIDPPRLRAISDGLWDQGHRFLITRDLEKAKNYVRERYENAPSCRFGVLASSKDKLLPNYGVDNTFQTVKKVRIGQWYNAPATASDSCCQLTTAVTEFYCQGLELDFAIVAWGSDLRRREKAWSDDLSGGYRRPVRNRLELRRNVYRVLLSRGRDGSIVYVPNTKDLDETADWLVNAGFRSI